MRTFEGLKARVGQLTVGRHGADSGDMCAMEAAAWLAGEEHSDHPRCVCPVIGAFVRGVNDIPALDGVRAGLLKRVPRLVGTVGSTAVQVRRARVAADGAKRFAEIAKAPNPDNAFLTVAVLETVDAMIAVTK